MWKEYIASYIDGLDVKLWFFLSYPFLFLDIFSIVSMYYFMVRLCCFMINIYRFILIRQIPLGNQNLFNRIMLNSWQGSVSVWVSPSDVPFVNRQQYETTQNVWHTTQVLLCLVILMTHPFHSYLVFSNVLYCSFSS